MGKSPGPRHGTKCVCLSGVCMCLHTSPCVPLLQASEKMELTTLWERVWPVDVISETPLSDWLE